MLRLSYILSLTDLASIRAFSKRTIAEDPFRSFSSLHAAALSSVCSSLPRRMHSLTGHD